VGAVERDEWLRAAWRVMVAKEVDPARLVFVDEMGANTSLYSLYAWSKKGERACCSTPRNRGKNTTLLASMTPEGMGGRLLPSPVRSTRRCLRPIWNRFS
jgi:hypothetical protein